MTRPLRLAMTTTALIERLEALDAPCRECDVLIDPVNGTAFHYTAYIDAAMTLVPEGWRWSLFGPDNQACLVNPDNPSQAATCDGANPAIALCIAALRAQETANGR